MSHGRRVVTAVALGAALAVVADSVVAWMNGPAEGGWFMYAPNQNTFVGSRSRGARLRDAALWLAAVAIWFGAAWRLFRAPDEQG